MKIVDLVEEVFSAILANKVRSGLTVLGIVIGIGSVIAMTAIGIGAQKSIEERIQSIGSNLLMVTPGAQRSPGERVSQGQGSAQTLTDEDLNVLEKIDLIESIAPVVSGNYQVVAEGQNTRTSITGTTDSYAQVRNIEIDEGVFIGKWHEDRLSRVAILGPDVKSDLFGENATNVLGKKIRINGIDFTIIGITKSKGGSGMNNDDDVIYVPISTANQYLTGQNFYSMLNLTVSDQNKMSDAEDQVTQALMLSHKISSEDDLDFNVMNQADIVETASSVTGTFTLLLGSVAGISLLVGGIGIMNMMLTTVTERMREIGLRKAIGASRGVIGLQFLAESAMLTLFGGFWGVGLGWLVSKGFSHFGSLETEVTLSSVLLAFGVSAFIGIAFGYYPAQKAAALNPIDALRYE